LGSFNLVSPDLALDYNKVSELHNNRAFGLIDYVSEDNLLEIKNFLNQFNDIKETEDKSVIKNFVYNALNLIPFLVNDNFDYKFTLIYP